MRNSITLLIRKVERGLAITREPPTLTSMSLSVTGIATT